jgi:peptidoglycan/LPS O-acetylase OafA/YrhL
MKRAVIVFILAAMVLFSTGLWFFSSSNKVNLTDLLGIVVILLVVGFAVFIGYRKFSSAKRGEPSEDELSKKVLQKTAAMSYYISLYLWLIMMYIQDKLSLETHTVLAIGMMGMAVTFAACWLIFNFRGIKNE